MGIATLDIINLVEHYPSEDEEIRALAQWRRRGGNATNTLVALSQWGHQTAWAGVLPEEPNAAEVKADLLSHHISLQPTWQPSTGQLPLSCVTLSKHSGSRTIVHYRNLPEYPFSRFAALDLQEYDWIHFEGRNLPDLRYMLERTREAKKPCSLEVEKPRRGIEACFELPEILLFSRHYAHACGHSEAETFLQRIPPRDKLCFLAWGKTGAWVKEKGQTRAFFHPAPKIEVRDSLGAGDVFNAAVIDGALHHHPPHQILMQAVSAASCHCTKQGFKLTSCR